MKGKIKYEVEKTKEKEKINQVGKELMQLGENTIMLWIELYLLPLHSYFEALTHMWWFLEMELLGDNYI